MMSVLLRVLELLLGLEPPSLLLHVPLLLCVRVRLHGTVGSSLPPVVPTLPLLILLLML